MLTDFYWDEAFFFSIKMADSGQIDTKGTNLASSKAIALGCLAVRHELKKGQKYKKGISSRLRE